MQRTRKLCGFPRVGGWSVLAVVLVGVGCIAGQAKWKEPPRVEPPPSGPSVAPPSDAIVLFDGTSLDKWRDARGRPARWRIVDGAMEVVPGTGNIFTRQEFGDCQLHIEWATPAEVKGRGQSRGNSGVYLQGRYEIQVLDSYNNKTYPTGMAGAFYEHFPPLVNVCRKPGEWQTYDIIFHPPRLAKDGKTIIPGSFTVFHNGVLIQDHVPVTRATRAAAFRGVVEKGPLMLQDHGCRVRYRNIWIRPIPPEGVHPNRVGK